MALLKKWKIELDQSVTDNGVEIVSPPLNENENPNLYVELEKVLDILKSNPADKTRKVYVNEQCGGHIHFDATMMKKKSRNDGKFFTIMERIRSSYVQNV